MNHLEHGITFVSILTAYHCPNNVVCAARYNHGTTGVYGNICYELVPVGYTWRAAESNCENKGGHLVHIRNPTEETNVMRFLHDSGFTSHAVWLGLTDLYQENTFYWSSGTDCLYSRLLSHFDNTKKRYFPWLLIVRHIICLTLTYQLSHFTNGFELKSWRLVLKHHKSNLRHQKVHKNSYRAIT